MNSKWVQPDIRDIIVDFVNYWCMKTSIKTSLFLLWLGIHSSKFTSWKKRYGKVNEHNASIPRDHWLEEWEKKAIILYYQNHPNEGYRRLTYMMMDDNIVAVSPATVYRVLSNAGLLNHSYQKASTKGKGFAQPSKPHSHWHIDITYINICGTFYYLCAILDGYSRVIVHSEIRTSMTEGDVEIILQRAKEKHLSAFPRIISDNGSQFVAKDFKLFIRDSGFTHARTSVSYPQSNGKIERWFESLKRESIRQKCPISLEDAKRIIDYFVQHYNSHRLHSALGYITPVDKLLGNEKTIFADRDRKLALAREKRRQSRQNKKSA